MPTTRSLEIDIFRGLALVFIVVDHISGSALAWTTLRNFGIADATEVFVFLAGVVTAIAYGKIASRQGSATADRRFMRRSTEIYRAFVIAALLIAASGGLLYWLQMDTPSVGGSQIKDFIAAPWRSLGEVLTLQRQPFLADILPMYAFFALLAPLAIRLAQRSAPMLLLASALLWLAAPLLGDYLPSVTLPYWAFNPFAWQFLFVMGVIAGAAPWVMEAPQGKTRLGLTVAAIIVVALGAIFSLFSYHESVREVFLSSWFEKGIGTFSKRDASAVRLINFLAMAWLMYLAVRRGWLTAVLHRIRAVAIIGRNGLVCFVGGAVISVWAEALSFAMARGAPVWPLNLTADLCAIAALFLLAYVRESLRSRARQGALAHPAPKPATPLFQAVPAVPVIAREGSGQRS